MSKDQEEKMDVDGNRKEDKVEKTVEKDPETLTIEDLREHCRSIEKGEASKEPRYITRLLRALVTTRKRLTGAVLHKIILLYFAHPTCAKQRDYLLKLTASSQSDSLEPMDVDKLSGGMPPRSPKPKRSAASIPVPTLLPEIEVYIHLLVLTWLLDHKQLIKAKECAEALKDRLHLHNRRTLDPLSARAYFYYSLVSERTGDLSKIREFLHSRLRTATLRHDDDGQATLINCLLRSYISDNLYDYAGRLIAKITFPENANNNEWARFFYYLGCIKAMQLEYSAAQKNLLQALRKSPQHTAVGFKQCVQKMLVTVELLLGEIPERSLFRQPAFRKPLQPYLQLTQAVRLGNVEKFNAVLCQFGQSFQRHGTYSLVVRLRQNVIKTAVKQISLAYSRISTEDIKDKLKLSQADDAEYIVAKCIRDGVIDASLNHHQRFMKSRETGDVYSTAEPQAQFHNRIAFCLEIHNQSVKAMRFPPKSYSKELESVEERREREQQDLEFAKEMAEEDDDFP